MVRTDRLAVLATLGIAAVIAWGTLRPPGGGSFFLPLTDKQIHALAFGALVLPIGWIAAHRLRWLAPAALGYGALIELVQPSVGRSGEFLDLAADAAGIAAASALCLWRRARARR